jgi:hypothetical protein
MARKKEFDGPTVGVRLTLEEAQVMDELRVTLGPVKLDLAVVGRLLIREALAARLASTAPKRVSRK